MKKVLIAGLGLIGGSLAANLKNHTLHELTGYDHDPQTLKYAKDQQIVDHVTSDFERAIQQADVCILACPVSITVDLIARIKTIPFKRPIVITDVASVKGNVMAMAESIASPYVTFIGGHPMAGSHKKGIQAAKSHLFENAIYVLSPTKKATDEHIAQLKNLLQSTQSKFVVLDAMEHDEMTSVISHFPHLVASALVNQAHTWQEKHPMIPTLAAGGFRDITRIASSNPSMWQDIFFQNKTILSRLIDDWMHEMKTLKTLLDHDDQATMYHYLEQAREYRDGLDRKGKGAIPAFYDLYVDIFDQSGALEKVISLLAKASISIKNIEILEIREGITGVLRISFTSQEDQLASHRLLVKEGYETMLEA